MVNQEGSADVQLSSQKDHQSFLSSLFSNCGCSVLHPQRTHLVQSQGPPWGAVREALAVSCWDPSTLAMCAECLAQDRHPPEHDVPTTTNSPRCTNACPSAAFFSKLLWTCPPLVTTGNSGCLVTFRTCPLSLRAIVETCGNLLAKHETTPVRACARAFLGEEATTSIAFPCPCRLKLL